jgi:ubiquinone/menaquinone biosynthesis C-methylase UbiE
MARVLKPAGRALIIDLKRNASPSEISRQVDDMHLSKINGILTKLAFKTMLLKSAYTRQEFEEMLAKTDFSRFEIREELIGLEVSMTR